MQHQRGFTLIELIIVIVILGILAVTAAPKFIDIQSDATASTLKGVKAALQGGSQLIYAKSAISGEQKNANTTATLATDNDDVDFATGGTRKVETHYGYPHSALTTAAMLNEWVEINSADFTLTVGTGTPLVGTFGLAPANSTPEYAITATDGASCHVLYTEAASASTAPVITVVTGGC